MGTIRELMSCPGYFPSCPLCTEVTIDKASTMGPKSMKYTLQVRGVTPHYFLDVFKIKTNPEIQYLSPMEADPEGRIPSTKAPGNGDQFLVSKPKSVIQILLSQYSVFTLSQVCNNCTTMLSQHPSSKEELGKGRTGHIHMSFSQAPAGAFVIAHESTSKLGYR